MRLSHGVSSLTLLAAGVLLNPPAHAQAVNTTSANVNVLNLLSPFLALNATDTGRTTLSTNLSQAIATNNTASLTQQQLAISDKNLLGSQFTTVAVGPAGTPTQFGVAANLAGGLPAQAPVTGTQGSITPQQPVGGLGSQLGAIYVTGVSTGLAGPLTNTVDLLTRAYTFTSSDLGVAKNYFANGAVTNPSVTPPNYVPVPAVAPPGYTLPTFNGLPNRTDSVLDIAAGVKNTDPGQDVYGSSRPVQVRPTGINQFDSTSIAGLATNPSFPSGHTNYGYTDSTLLAMLVPQEYQSMLLRGSEYGNSRIVLGVHYPLDIIASRSFSAYDLAQAFTNPLYIANAGTTGAAINLPTLFTAAAPEVQTYLAAQCGASVATCAASAANTANDPYVASTANQATYVARLSYGLPTLTFAQAPREAAPASGPDASILLAPVFGGSTAAAAALAPTGGLNGTLQTSTINQIIVNTENNALAAFYGTALSYWSRIDLYSAAGYFGNVAGTLSLASTDRVTTAVTIGRTGVLDANGAVTGTTTVTRGGRLTGSGTVAGVTVSEGGTLAPGSLAAQAALATGTTSVTNTVLTMAGPLVFAPGASYAVTATPTQVTRAAVTGTATLAGTVAVQLSAATPFSNAAILNAAAVTGTFAGATTNLPFLAASLAYDANDVFLSVNRSPAALRNAAATPNQLNVAAALGNGAGAGGPLVDAVFGLGSVQQARATFDTLSGEGIVATENAGIRAARIFSSAIDDQALSWLTGGLGAANAVTLGDLPADVTPYASVDRIPSPIVVRAPAPRTYRVWATGFGGGTSFAGNANVAGETGSFYGGVLGLDYQVAPNILVGIAGGGSDSTFNVASRATSGDVTGAHGGVYSLIDFGPFYGENSVTVSSFSNNTTRAVPGFGGLTSATQKASFSSLDIRTRAEFGRVYDYGDFYGSTALKVTPFVALEIARLRSNGFAEYDAGGAGNVFGLSSAGRSTADVPGFVGARFESAYAMGGGALLRPMLTLAYLHEFAPQRTLQNGFLSLPGSAFLVSGARPSSNAVTTKAGFELDMGRGVGLFANFDGEFSDREKVYGGKGGLRVTW